jgi:hypothetical protein
VKNRDIILGPQGEPLELRYSDDQPREANGEFGSGQFVSGKSTDPDDPAPSDSKIKKDASEVKKLFSAGVKTGDYTKDKPGFMKFLSHWYPNWHSDIHEKIAAAVGYRFDPDQPREANGEWGSGGEGATKTEDPERAARVTAARSELEKQMNVHDGAPKDTVAKAVAMMSEKISPDTVRAAGWLEVYKLDNTSSKLGDGFKTNGSYNFQNRSIDTRANVGTFIHEYGHHITSRLDFNKPEGVDPKAYRAVKDAAINEFRVATGVGPKDAAVGIGARWTKITPAEARRAPSAYALTNFKEWQAESFMMYMQGGKHEERLQKVAPDTYKYIDSIVRNSYK